MYHSSLGLLQSQPTKASWSSFDDFGDFASSQTGSNSQTKSRKRLREEDTKTINTKPSNRRKNVANDDLWVDKHAPNNQVGYTCMFRYQSHCKHFELGKILCYEK